MKREPLSGYLAVNLTPSDRESLERLAEEHGATLSGIVRKLIREAARTLGQQQAERRGSYEQTSPK